MIGTLLSLPAGLFFLHCGGAGTSTQDQVITTTSNGDVDSPAAQPRAAGDQIIYTSSVTSEHSHTMTLAVTMITSPPEGGTQLNTSVAEGHVHPVAISDAHLLAAGRGESVKIVTGSAAGHTHVFTLVKVG